MQTFADLFASALPDIAEVRVEDARGRTICSVRRGTASPSSTGSSRRFEAPIESRPDDAGDRGSLGRVVLTFDTSRPGELPEGRAPRVALAMDTH